MKNYLILIAFICSLAACTPSKESMLEEINAFEKSEKTGTAEGLAELAKMHKEYGLKYNDVEGNNYLYAAGQYYYYENDTNEAKTILTEYITRDDSTERFRNAAINLAILHGKTAEYKKADELISEVLDNDLPTSGQWQDIIKLYEAKTNAASEATPQDYERLAMAYTAVSKFPQAVSALDKAATDYPKYENRANILYRAGFLGWEYLKDKDVASKYYNQFLIEYPNDPKAKEVQGILNGGMLTMTNEQIIEMFKAKNK